MPFSHQVVVSKLLQHALADSIFIEGLLITVASVQVVNNSFHSTRHYAERDLPG